MRFEDKILSDENFSSLITDGAMRLVEEMAKKHNTKDRHAILGYVCAEMERRYPGSSLEYHLDQMKIESIGDILDVIDVYLILEAADPSITFMRTLRKKRQGKRLPAERYRPLIKQRPNRQDFLCRNIPKAIRRKVGKQIRILFVRAFFLNCI